MKGPDDLSTDAVMAWALGMRKATPVELALEESERRSAEEKRQQSSSPASESRGVPVPAPADARDGDVPRRASPPRHPVRVRRGGR